MDYLWTTVNQSKPSGHYLYHWSVITIIYVYFHNVCTTILLFKPLGTRVVVIRKLLLESVK